MVFQNINRIKKALPEVCHVVMFYNNGTVFQTSFEPPINIPKLGENIAEMLNHAEKVYDICEFKLEEYKKIVLETENISMIILKLGEDSNIALFFKKDTGVDLKLTSIRRYLKQIEKLIDVDIKELEELEKEETEKVE